MLVSLILPIKNGMPNLAQAIEGLKEQTYTNFELVVQDSCSTDGSVEYLRSLDLPFPMQIVVEKDASLTDGYNRGIQRASGNLVSLIACDEVLDPGAIQAYIDWYAETPSAVYICGGSRLLGENNSFYQEFSPPPFSLLNYCQHLTCHTMCGAFNRDLLGPNLYYDTSLSSVPDFEIMMRLALSYGEDKVIFKPNIFMTAKADRSSMTYRHEAYDQMVRDKITILSRIFCPRSTLDRIIRRAPKKNLPNFLYKKALFGVYKWAATSLFCIPDGESSGVIYALEAEKIFPGNSDLRHLVGQSKSLRWNESTGRLEKRVDLSKSFDVLQKEFRDIPLLPQDTNVWGVVNGVRVEKVDDKVDVITPPVAWNYALIIKLPFPPEDLSDNFIWIELGLRSTMGNITISLLNSHKNIIYNEVLVEKDTKFHKYLLECFSLDCDSVLIRNGGLNATGHLEIQELRLIYADKKRAMEA